MAELIQFPCPVCGTTLRLPLAMAGENGPCPCCGREIVAPDPHHGVGARIYCHAPAPALMEPFQPFAASPDDPAPQKEPILSEKKPQTVPPAPLEMVETEKPAPAIPTNPPAAPSRGPNAAILVLSILLTAVTCLVTGYLLGMRSDWIISRTPFPVMPPLELMENHEKEPPKPVLVKPMTDPIPQDPPVAPLPPPEPTTTPPPPPPAPPDATKASALAEASLKAFLAASDWAARSAYVLKPETVRPAMESYSKQKPDGPTAYQSITVENSHTDKQTGYTLFIFKLVTELHPSGFPVAVAETDSGWLVDWESFVEFRDDHFRAFADGPAERSGKFHVVVRQPPAERAASTENEHFSSFLLDPPLPGRQRIAYIRKGTETHTQLINATANSGIFWPILELAKRKAPDGRTFLEITGLVADNWLPETR